MKKINNFVIYTLFFIIALSLTSLINKGQHKSNTYWKKSSNNRMPASILTNLNKQKQMYQDYFSHDTAGKYVKYDLDYKFWTNKNKADIREKSKIAFHNAISKTLVGDVKQGKDSQESLQDVFKKNLTESLVDEFIKTLFVFNIMNGKFQFDFEISPNFSNNINIDDELHTNQLISLNDRNKLTGLINQQALGLKDKVSQTYIPSDNNNYQFMGGSITLNLDILDLSWDPTQPIPKPTKNALKGFVRFRRYFRINNPELYDLAIKDDSIEVSQSPGKFKLIKGSKQYFITVDIYKKFNIENPAPTLDRIEISLGKIKTNTPSNRKLFNIFKKKDKDIATAKYILRGNYTYKKHQYEFESELKTLRVNDFESLAFVQKDTIETKILTPQRAFARDISSTLIKKINQSLLSVHAMKIIKSLDLARLSYLFKN